MNDVNPALSLLCPQCERNKIQHEQMVLAQVSHNSLEG